MPLNGSSTDLLESGSDLLRGDLWLRVDDLKDVVVDIHLSEDGPSVTDLGRSNLQNGIV